MGLKADFWAPTFTSSRNWDQVPCFEKLKGNGIKLPRMQIKVLGLCPTFPKYSFWDKSHIFKSKHLWLKSGTTQLRAQAPIHATSSVKFRAVGSVNLRIGRHWKPRRYGLSKDMGAFGFVNLTFSAYQEYNWEPRSKSSTAHHEYNWEPRSN